MGPITIKSQRELGLMREAGRVVARVLEELSRMVAPGLPTIELDRRAAQMVAEAGGEPLFLGVPCPMRSGPPFPGAICCSINEEVVHGIPSERRIAEGDVVSIDFGIRLNGYCGDAATTVPCGPVGADVQRLLDTTRRVLDLAIRESRANRTWSEVAARMEKTAHDNGLSVVEKYVGHGIGTQMWEPPKVPNFVSRELMRNGPVLHAGMTLAVEPMLNLGGKDTRVLKDHWTVVTRDGRPSAHFEHTIVIEEDGARPLTLP